MLVRFFLFLIVVFPFFTLDEQVVPFSWGLQRIKSEINDFPFLNYVLFWWNINLPLSSRERDDFPEEYRTVFSPTHSVALFFSLLFNTRAISCAVIPLPTETDEFFSFAEGSCSFSFTESIQARPDIFFPESYNSIPSSVQTRRPETLFRKQIRVETLGPLDPSPFPHRRIGLYCLPKTKCI